MNRNSRTIREMDHVSGGNDSNSNKDGIQSNLPLLIAINTSILKVADSDRVGGFILPGVASDIPTLQPQRAMLDTKINDESGGNQKSMENGLDKMAVPMHTKNKEQPNDTFVNEDDNNIACVIDVTCGTHSALNITESNDHNQEELNTTKIAEWDKIGAWTWNRLLQPLGWRKVPSMENSKDVLVAPGLTRLTATEGLTRFASFQAIGKTIEEKYEGRTEDLIDNAITAGAIPMSFWDSHRKQHVDKVSTRGCSREADVTDCASSKTNLEVPMMKCPADRNVSSQGDSRQKKVHVTSPCNEQYMQEEASITEFGHIDDTGKGFLSQVFTWIRKRWA